MFSPTIEVGAHSRLKSGFLSLHAHAHTHTHYTHLYRRHSVTWLVDAAAFGLSESAFLPTIQSQATDEQRAKWLPLIQDYRIIGAYAQTEMGHGNALVC